MISRFEAYMDGIALSSVHPCIYIIDRPSVEAAPFCCRIIFEGSGGCHRDTEKLSVV